ncbi:MAG: fused MFS/spermidine synthase [Candidatus Riflebacteria bacterium]|nr:fused MFS/spermidine synthase [Candidatus Riflebacteria bacterium]
MVTAIFTLGIFAGSFLLFLVQPMVGKILLPVMGGAPAVWTTCMLFFQMMLLAGYLYAEKTLRYLGCMRQSILHVLLMTGGCILLPLNVQLDSAEQAIINPTSWLMMRLIASVGFLFFMISANAPLLQRYYSQAGQNDSGDPYFLYSASNAGSLLALLAYPFLIEPFFTLTAQRNIWSALYFLQIIFVIFCSMTLRHSENRISSQSLVAGNSLDTDSSTTWRQSLFWVILGFIPCSAMLAVTTHFATDIASLPLLWVIPLSLYLISFIFAFARNSRWRDIDWENYMFPVVLLAMIIYQVKLVERIWLTIPIHLLAMFLICMYFHCRLAKSRPAVELLNSFYVWMSVGGIAGGIFNGIIAPAIFVTQAEYILTLFAAVIFASAISKKLAVSEFSFARKLSVFVLYVSAITALAFMDEYNMIRLTQEGGIFLALVGLLFVDAFYRAQRLAWISLLIILAIGPFVQQTDAPIVLTTRSFFGIMKVTRIGNHGKFFDPDLRIEADKDLFYLLQHGTTLHGIERRVESMRMKFPLSYYSRESPVGTAMRAGMIGRRFKNIGVVGLGVGTLVWYGRDWQHFDFFEIDPVVIEIAENPKLFSYLEKSKASWQNFVGDARISLQKIADSKYDLLILDAYSSDAVPIHLLTVEAFRLYQKKTRPDGIMLFHVSNRYFNLTTVIKRICDELGLACLFASGIPSHYSVRYDKYDFSQIISSQWVAVAADPAQLEKLKRYHRWQKIASPKNFDLWTDDYANLFKVFLRR